MDQDTPPSDPARYFGSDDDIVEYIAVWLEDGSPHEIARAVGDVARARGITEILSSTGERQALYSALSRDGNPTLELFVAVLHALGLELSVKKTAA